MPSQFATEDENVFQLLGDPRMMADPALGDPSQRRRAIEALEARAPQIVL